MKKIIISIVILLVIILSLIVINNMFSYTYVINVDTNIGYEVYLDDNYNIIKYIRYKDNNKKIFIKKYNFNKFIEMIISDNREFINEDNSLLMIMNGNIDFGDFEKKLNNSDVFFDIRWFENPTEEEIKISNKYKITTVKASLVNSAFKNVMEVSIEKLVNKSINELMNMESLKMYCPDDYILEGTRCIREVGIKEPLWGKICPNNYYEYNGICYKIGDDYMGDKLVCRTNYKLVGEECIWNQTYDGEAICEKGEYNGKNCVYREEKEDIKEYCYDPNRYLYNHKCLATKPLLNGGCPGNGNEKRGNKCVNFKDDMTDSSYSCGKKFYIQNQMVHLIAF